MARYVLQRLIYMVLTLFLIATFTFFLMQMLPGSPLKNQEKLSPEQKTMILEKYGLNDPVPVQYVRYMSNLLQGDLGISLKYDGREVTDMIVDRIGPSARLGFQALLLGTLLGIILGAIAALKRNTWVDYTSTVVSVMGISIPSFVFAALLQYYIAVKLQWLPVAFWGTTAHTILPTIALSVFVIATVARFMRTELVEVLNSDYILTAKAKGVGQVGIIVKHALRNAMIPIITVLGPLSVGLMTGTLVIEKIFAVPGLGEQFANSILTNDYALIMGTSLFYSALLIFVIFIVDLLYGIIDPRIRLAGGKN